MNGEGERIDSRKFLDSFFIALHERSPKAMNMMNKFRYQKKSSCEQATRYSAVFLWVEKLRISRGDATHIAVYDEMFGFGSRKLCVV